MHGALLVEEPLSAAKPEHPFVPDVRMDVESLTPVEAEADEALRRHVVTRRRERNIERTVVERKEQLAAVRVIVRVPQQHPAWRFSVVGAGCFGWSCVGEHVMPADCCIAP